MPPFIMKRIANINAVIYIISVGRGLTPPFPNEPPDDMGGYWVTVYTVSVVVNIAFVVIRRGEGTPPYGNILYYTVVVKFTFRVTRRDEVIPPYNRPQKRGF